MVVVRSASGTAWTRHPFGPIWRSHLGRVSQVRGSSGWKAEVGARVLGDTFGSMREAMRAVDREAGKAEGGG
jgi:hypothetical protein